MEWWHYVVAVLGSAFAGAINTFAGNGSAITLTILTELLQLPGNMANGTNRIGVFSQTVLGSWAFYRNGKLDLSRGWPYLLPTIIGAIAGGVVAIWVSNEQFRQVFRFMMIFMLLVILVKPKRWLRPSDTSFRMNPFLAVPLFLLLGFYGGFIQMGMGIFFLALMVLGARYSIIESNAMKLFVVGVYTVFIIGLFQWRGLIHWPIGLLMAVGQGFGGWATAVFAARYPKADVLAYWMLVIVVIAALFMLFDVPELLFRLM
jgi:uncharacterized membrane protein YfcA